MLSSLFTGVSGLNANTLAMSVIGDNVANTKTVGFKSNRAFFSSLLSASLGGATSVTGLGGGVQFWGSNALWTQGSLETSNSPTDLAIYGNGLFVVRDTESGTNYFTRAGVFSFDKDGKLVNPDGLVVRGYEVDKNGKLGGIVDIDISSANMTPSATTEMTFGMNLDAAAEKDDEFSASMTTYNSLGNPVTVTITFTKKAAGEWDWKAACSDSGATCTGSGTLKFDGDGKLTSPSEDPEIKIESLSDGASNMEITWKVVGNITGYAGKSAVNAMNQNGYPSGSLQNVYVDEQGQVTGVYSNSKLVPFFQIVLADFNNLWGLNKIGKSLYQETLNSGEPVYGTAGTGRLGNISPSSIEMSNADLATEFVNMITTQRSFQANSKVITVSDEILQELINMKR